MPAAETVNTNVFAVDDEFNTKAEVIKTKEESPSRSPSSFLGGLGSVAENSSPMKQEAESFTKNTASFSSQPFAPVDTQPSFSMKNISGGSPLAQNIVTQMKERMDNIKSWKDFFAPDQFHMPQSTTVAQSRVSHNVNHFQNNYLMFVLLLAAFSL